eukprot:gnl/Dysnectes_brevis/6610_a10395_345.p1 GENE.gnl/Dysnectes_brevis/6610_a10395_345~~gnl/Dysnectes_brevis/6610_a10395_345.p1  ORF type:complete len:697 (+),score=11.75 gnl/Dysnectes_brevis/6610_a10395_345:221-2092(+)
MDDMIITKLQTEVSTASAMDFIEVCMDLKKKRNFTMHGGHQNTVERRDSEGIPYQTRSGYSSGRISGLFTSIIRLTEMIAMFPPGMPWVRSNIIDKKITEFRTKKLAGFSYAQRACSIADTTTELLLCNGKTLRTEDDLVGDMDLREMLADKLRRMADVLSPQGGEPPPKDKVLSAISAATRVVGSIHHSFFDVPVQYDVVRTLPTLPPVIDTFPDCLVDKLAYIAFRQDVMKFFTDSTLSTHLLPAPVHCRFPVKLWRPKLMTKRDYGRISDYVATYRSYFGSKLVPLLIMKCPLQSFCKLDCCSLKHPLDRKLDTQSWVRQPPAGLTGKQGSILKYFLDFSSGFFGLCSEIQFPVQLTNMGGTLYFGLKPLKLKKLKLNSSLSNATLMIKIVWNASSKSAEVSVSNVLPASTILLSTHTINDAFKQPFWPYLKKLFIWIDCVATGSPSLYTIDYSNVVVKDKRFYKADSVPLDDVTVQCWRYASASKLVPCTSHQISTIVTPTKDQISVTPILSVSPIVVSFNHTLFDNSVVEWRLKRNGNSGGVDIGVIDSAKAFLTLENSTSEHTISIIIDNTAPTSSAFCPTSHGVRPTTPSGPFILRCVLSKNSFIITSCKVYKKIK